MSVSFLLLPLLGCAPQAVPVTVEGPRVWVEAAQVDAGAPVLLHAPADVDIPAVEGLEARRSTVSEDGTAVWELRGESGSYEVQVPLAGGEPVTLFLDIGTAGPKQELAPLFVPEEEAPPLWPWLLAGVPVIAGAGLLARRFWEQGRAPRAVPAPETASERARRRWRELRGDANLAPEALALALSEVYRDWLAETQDWPARSRTTREILDNLAGSLTFAQLERAQRLLGAMDLVKFSEQGAHAALFEALDSDFDSLLSAAAPVHMSEGPHA